MASVTMLTTKKEKKRKREQHCIGKNCQKEANDYNLPMTKLYKKSREAND